jgi:hypothetical protein
MPQYRIPSFEDFEVNEGLFKDQVPMTITNKLKPGSVIYASTNIKPADVDYARMSDSKIGRVTKLNTSNWYKNEGGFSTDSPDSFYTRKGGELIGVIMSDGCLTNTNFSIDIHEDSPMLRGLNLLFHDNKIEIGTYDKHDEAERKSVFKYNFYNTFRGKDIVIKDLNIEFESNSKDAGYMSDKDLLTLEKPYDVLTGEQKPGQKIKNASKRDDITCGGKNITDY